MNIVVVIKIIKSYYCYSRIFDKKVIASTDIIDAVTDKY
jgi:hypothetical protein